MAKGWKGVAEKVLARSGIAAASERRQAPSITILAYHNIVPRGEQAVGDLSLHTDQEEFGRQLDYILERRTVVSLADALRVDREPEGNEVVITFDDAYTGTLTAGVEELHRRGLPATVFVPPGMLGSDGFWWDQLDSGDATLPESARDHALTELGGAQERVLAWARDEGIRIRQLPDHAHPATPNLLDAIPDAITWGAHTWAHPNLRALPDDEAEEEMAKSRRWLVEQSHPWVDAFAYPYGLFNPASERLARDLFQASVLITGGPSVRRGQRASDAALIPRLNVPRGLTLEGLALRLAGLLP